MAYINTKIKRDIFNPNIIYVDNYQYNYNKTYIHSTSTMYVVKKHLVLNVKQQ